jgi:two-component system, chemotaxis family, chemotaxis protein CheY
MLCWLVVDDSEIIRKVARRVLEDMNYMVIEADNGTAALEQCAKAMPQLILLDWHMPGMTGHEFLSLLHSIPTDRKPIVVYCTTENDPTDIARAFAGGAEALLMKPFNRATLKAKVGEVALLAA